MFRGPCRDCTCRYPACHDHCEIFAEAKKKYEHEKELSKADDIYRSYALSSSFDRWNFDLKKKRNQAGYVNFKRRN